MKNLLVILSARTVSDEMKNLLGDIPDVLTPYADTTILEGVAKKNSTDFDIKVALYENSEDVLNVIKEKKIPVEAIKINYLGNIIDTMKQVDISGYDNVTYLFGDTLVENWDLSEYVGNKIAYAEVNESVQWTTFDKEEKQIIIYDKVERDLKDKYNAFIGIFSFDNLALLQELWKKNTEFYDLIKEYNHSLSFNFVEESKWVNLGHIGDFQENSKKIVQARFFNEISIDGEKGKLIKRSTEKEKFTNEIKWYLKLPKELEHYSPRIFSYDLSYENLFVEMEYYAYMTLHQVYVHGNYSIQKWNKILDVLLNTNREFRNFKLEAPKTEINHALNNIYVKKTLERFEKLKESEDFTSFFEGTIKINGEEYPNLTTVSELLPSIIEKYLLNIDEFSIIHGDYFFANILYDPNMNFIRLIDPRGDFGGYGIYGDTRYDLAKLSHSLNGKYDFIVSDEFTLESTGKEINYSINSSTRHDKIKDLFYSKLGDQAQEIQLIESLLFLSMVPLHSDYPSRQKVMISKGLELFTPFIKGEKL
ncbi:MAG: hypothetical protein ACK5NF_06275 [Bacilli bacterium]